MAKTAMPQENISYSSLECKKILVSSSSGLFGEYTKQRRGCQEVYSFIVILDTLITKIAESIQEGDGKSSGKARDRQ